MDWDGISAVSEIIGALAVVTSLLYLAMQVKQSNRQEAVSGLQEAIREFVNAYAATTATDIDAKNFRQGLTHFDEMPRDEQAIFNSKMQYLLSGFNQVMVLYHRGLLDDDEFAAMERTFLWVALSKGAQEWWTQFKHMPPKPLVEYLDRRMNEARGRMKPANHDVNWLKIDDLARSA